MKLEIETRVELSLYMYKNYISYSYTLSKISKGFFVVYQSWNTQNVTKVLGNIISYCTESEYY